MAIGCEVWNARAPAGIVEGRDIREGTGIPGRVAVGAGVSDYWRKYVGLDGTIIGIDTFGESAPADALFRHFGFTVDNVVAAVRRMIQQTDAEAQSMRKQP